MTAQQVYDTSWIPEMYADKNGRVDVVTIDVALAGGSANATVIAATAGKATVVLYGNIASQGLASGVRFKTTSGSLIFYNVPANTAATPNVPIGPCKFGAIYVPVGLDLQADTGAVQVEIGLTYFKYTP